MTTKEQELKALAQIKKIVDSLGEGSYIGMAFEGCFEIAEENIQNDWGCSMKQRAESAEKKIEGLEKLLKETSDRLNRTIKAMNINNENATSEINRLQDTINELSKKLPNDDDLTDCIQLAEEKEAEADQEAKEAAAMIVELAENPASEEFRQAVKTNRAAREKADYYKALRTRLARAKK